MFPRLIKDKTFLKDLEFWKSKINSITNEKIRAKGQRLLSQYLNHARQIDAGHDATYGKELNLESVRENVTSLQNFRERIEKFVHDIDN